MAHEHEWQDFGVVTSWSIGYKDVKICKVCRTFRLETEDGQVVERS